MSTDSEEVLKWFDFYWFEHEIFMKKQPLKSSIILSLDEQIEPKLKLSSTPSFLRSFSDQNLSSKDSFLLANSSDHSLSPKSVLMPKLQTILSGKEVGEFNSDPAKSKGSFEDGKMRRKKGRRSKDSKSLSELEFEELKGFMDLGFVFSNEDKDSSLVSIIPGLQRLGRKTDVGEEEARKKDFVHESVVSRPYLSEAWDVLEEKKAEKKVKNPLMNWRINPTLGTEMEIKDQLRFWAHTVASTVR